MGAAEQHRERACQNSDSPRGRSDSVIHQVISSCNALVNGKKSPAALFVPDRPWTAPFGPTSGRPNALQRVCRTSASLPSAKGATFAAYLGDTSASPTGSY